MATRQRGQRARAALVLQRQMAETRAVANLPPTATVAEVVGPQVRINDETELIGRAGVVTKVGDVGVVLPLAGGGRVFIPTESTITGEDVPVTTVDATTVTDALGSKRAEGVPIPQTEVTSSTGKQDLAEDIGGVLSDLLTKRDEGVPVPQTEVESSQGNQNLAADISAQLVEIANKRDVSVLVPQVDVESSQGNQDLAEDISGNLAEIIQTQLEAMVSRRLPLDEATSTTGSTIISGTIDNPFGWDLKANTTYQLLVHLDVEGSTTDGNFNGVLFGLDVPTGATIEGSIVSRVTGVSDRFVRRITTPGLDSLLFSANSLTPFDAEIRATIVNGATEDFLWISYGGLESGDTATIKAGSNARLQIAP